MTRSLSAVDGRGESGAAAARLMFGSLQTALVLSRHAAVSPALHAFADKAGRTPVDQRPGMTPERRRLLPPSDRQQVVGTAIHGDSAAADCAAAINATAEGCV